MTTTLHRSLAALSGFPIAPNLLSIGSDLELAWGRRTLPIRQVVQRPRKKGLVFECAKRRIALVAQHATNVFRFVTMVDRRLDQRDLTDRALSILRGDHSREVVWTHSIVLPQVQAVAAVACHYCNRLNDLATRLAGCVKPVTVGAATSEKRNRFRFVASATRLVDRCWFRKGCDVFLVVSAALFAPTRQARLVGSISEECLDRMIAMTSRAYLHEAIVS